MTILILSLVVLSQIVLFQIMAGLANRSIVLHELKSIDGPPPEQLLAHVREAPRFRLSLGIIFGLVALLPLTGVFGSHAAGKLLLAVISVTSATAFVLANTRDRDMMRLLVDHTPGGSVRRASLERRSLAQIYPPALEVIPMVLFVATLLFLVSAPGFMVSNSATSDLVSSGVRTHALILLALQGLTVFGGFYYTLRKGINARSMATVIPSLRKSPEVALHLGEQLAGVQLRFFMFARIAITMLLGSAVVEKALDATGNPGAATWDGIGWGLVAILLVTFFFYLKRVGKISRQMQKTMDVANHTTANAG